jgi:hypothetical protein
VPRNLKPRWRPDPTGSSSILSARIFRSICRPWTVCRPKRPATSRTRLCLKSSSPVRHRITRLTMVAPTGFGRRTCSRCPASSHSKARI